MTEGEGLDRDDYKAQLRVAGGLTLTIQRLYQQPT